MSKTITVLGSTGSIGVQTLDVAEREGYTVEAITVNSNIALAETQCRRFGIKKVCVGEKYYKELKTALSDTNVTVLSGIDGIIQVASECKSDVLFNSLMGMVGLRPTLAAIGAGVKRIALANKEALVAGGDLVMSTAREKGVEIIPVDSEHSAIFQCLRNQNGAKKILLTASGGPFFGKKREELENITPEMALKHPNWSMGAKITVDSSTLMNKGLEVIEAAHLFGFSPKDIQVVVHRESIIHSMVEFADGAVIAQLGSPDMRLCIQYAATYPERKPSPVKGLDFYSLSKLTFCEPDRKTFTLLDTACNSFDKGGNTCAVMNGANEEAVSLFLKGEIKYLDIFRLVEDASQNVKHIKVPTLWEILESDKAGREYVLANK